MVGVESVPVTLEVLAKALHAASPAWYASAPVLTLIGVAVGALIGIGGNWYLKQMDRESWLQQKRWDLKYQSYAQLAEHFGELHSLIRELLAATGPNDDRFATALRERFELSRRYAAIARIVVAPDVRTMLVQFGDRWESAGDDMTARAAATRETWDSIVIRAREDLGLERRALPAA